MDKKEENSLIGNKELFKSVFNDKNQYIEKKRKYGIDLFKILATINVVILHINKHSGLIKLKPYSSKYKAIWFLEILAYWAVDGFGLISGYVGYKKYKYSNLIYIWIEVLFYSILVTIILLFINEISYKKIFYCFFPILTNRHWYVNAYFSMYLFLPFINEGIKNLNKNILRNIVIFFILFFSFYHVIAKIIKKTEYNFLNNGYSTTWLVILYIIGGFFGKYVINNEKKAKIKYYIFWIIMYLFLSFFTFKVFLKNNQFKKYIPNNLFIDYLSPTILFQAISLLMLFSKLNVKNIFIQNIINFISPLNFSVILIHGDLFQTRNTFINKFFKWIINYKGSFTLLRIYLIGIFIYIMCVLIDYLRFSLFRLLKIKKLCELIENIKYIY